MECRLRVREEQGMRLQWKLEEREKMGEGGAGEGKTAPLLQYHNTGPADTT